MGGRKKQTVGYKYYVGMLGLMCHGPIDKITKIFYGEKVAWTGTSTGGRITIAAPNLLGGEFSEGGISGSVDVCMGGPTQPVNDYLAAKLGALCPAHRGIFSLVFRKIYWGTQAYLKTLGVLATRIHTAQDGALQWYDAKAEINGDMNAAHIIREALTNSEWGLGAYAVDVDDASFTAAADTLYAEGFGLSVLWEEQGTIEEFINDIKAHVDANLYVHPRTGKWTLRLIRDDYDVADLPILGEAEISRVEDYIRPAFGDLSNSVTVKFWDKTTLADSALTIDDPALVQMQGAVINVKHEYPACTSKELAGRLGQRDLKAVSSQLLSCVIYCNRVAADLLPGDQFLFDWPDLHAAPIVMRVSKIEVGDGRNNAVKITCVEDVFSTPAVAMSSGETNEWIDPENQPIGATTGFYVEAPYWELVQRFGQPAADALLTSTPDTGLALATGSPAAYGINAIVLVDGVQLPDFTDFSPHGVLASAVSLSATSIQITGDFEPDAGSHIQVGPELMRFDGFDSSGRAIVGRGVLDTVPVAHSTGAAVWAWDAFATTDETGYADGEILSMQIQPRNNSRVGSVTAPVNITMDGRAIRPYPPGKVQLDGAAYPEYLVADGSIDITWAHRDRTQQIAGALVDTTAGNIGPEVGTEYRLRLYLGGSGTPLVDTTLSGTTYAATTVTPYSTLRVRLGATLGAYASWQEHDFTVKTAGNIVTRSLSTPPGSPATGARYIVGTAPTGAWAGHEDDVALWSGSAWSFSDPVGGWVSWLIDEAKAVHFSSSGWN